MEWSRSMPTFVREEVQLRSSTVARTRLEQMEMLVLLDLLGASAQTSLSSSLPSIPMYDRSTSDLHHYVIRIEQRLRELDQLLSHSKDRNNIPINNNNNNNYYFMAKQSDSHPEDDHLPFMERGVPILHWIPQPFPSVWHTMDDRGEALDVDQLEDYSRILRVLVYEYLELDGC